MMKYGKEYARKVFELIPEANLVAVDEDGLVSWSDGELHIPQSNSFWVGNSKFEVSNLGKVECDDWRESLISREEVGL